MYLKGLKKQDIVKVGTSLGLDSVKLGDARAEEILNEMIHMWLIQQDYVIDVSGTPMLRSLIKALEDNDFKGHANAIKSNISEK